MTVPSPFGLWLVVADAHGDVGKPWDGAVHLCSLLTATHTREDALARLATPPGRRLARRVSVRGVPGGSDTGPSRVERPEVAGPQVAGPQVAGPQAEARGSDDDFGPVPPDNTSHDGAKAHADAAARADDRPHLHLADAAVDAGTRHPAAIALTRYFDGDLTAVNSARCSQPGGVFSQRAWSAMREVQPGRVMTYAELAGAADSPGAARAAGSACAENRIALFVPCHRIVRADGSTGDYFYGSQVKQVLLAHEGWRGPTR